MIAAHLNRKTVCRFRQSLPLTHCLLATLTVGLASGCRAPHLQELTRGDEIEVRLDANARVHVPGRKIKFFVDLVNQTHTKVDVRGVRIELRASPRGRPETISLTHTWRYLWENASPPLPPLRPGKRMTIPVVPERGVEFPLEILRAGDYDIVAVVNGRFISGPYPLALVRPDLEAYGRESTMPGPHRTFDGENRRLSIPGRGSERSRDRRGFRSGRAKGERS